ncbi:lysine-rich nucleolar protein 1 [Callorhinchus milii]|uniref:lysine-rich nucleolar protein 1 n=1 Tax=Callorhinchus milii TaxID=7868 RepID=UPI001C3FBB3F|nr:lysine-rich nucleolar protein 1 [Callorhinchus milii]
MLKNDDENSQVNLINKKKKKKESGTAPDVVDQTEVDNNSPEPESRKRKKKSKEKPVSTDASDSNCPSCPDEQNSPEKSAKRKKKKKDRTGGQGIAGDVPCQGERNLDTDKSLRNRNRSEMHESSSGSSKMKKNKLKPNETLTVASAKDQSSTPNVSRESNRKMHEDEMESGAGKTNCNVKKKKGDKSRNEEEGRAKGNQGSSDAADVSEEAADISNDRDEMDLAKKKKKKKKRFHSEEIKLDSKEQLSAGKTKREKHRDIAQLEEAETRSGECQVANVRKPKDGQALNVLHPRVEATDERCLKKKKKKEKLQCEDQQLQSETKTLSEARLPENKRQMTGQINGDKKCVKSKRCKMSAAVKKEEGLTVSQSQPVEDLKTAPSVAEKKKRIPQPVSAVIEDLTKIKRKKKQMLNVGKIKVEIESQESDGELQIMSEKKGNVFEATIDKARRQALQAEIDRVSGKTNTLETGAVSETKPLDINPLDNKQTDIKQTDIKPHCTQFGQWNTASFQNPEQQNKFLRLMGGFKKSNQHLLTGVDSEKPNMALNKSDEQKLNTHLQSDFEKALNFRQNRGIGLGFRSPQQQIQSKMFYIDKNASTSSKFNLD